MKNEIFEIHITGEKSEIDKLGMKTISVELLKPDFSVLRTEYMTSQALKFSNFDACFEYVNSLGNFKRIKIECPVYEHYIDKSLYLESHFYTKKPYFPLSRNINKEELMGTDRVYCREEYSKFMNMWHGEILELCLFDSFVEEDFDWFNLYKEDPRKVGLKAGLRQLNVEQLNKVIDYEGEMVLDSFNYSSGKFCPLAVGLGLEVMENPTHEKVFNKLIDLGFKVYNTRGIVGEFYTKNRKEDLIIAAKEVIEEKVGYYGKI